MLISINGHYYAMSQNMFWPTFLNRLIIFKFYFKNSCGKVVFQIWSRDSFRETKFCFLTVILKRNIFWSFFLLIYFFFGGVYTHMVQVQVSYKNFYGKVLKNDGIQVDPHTHTHTHLCTNRSEK